MYSEFPNIFDISQIILNRNRCAKNFDSFSHIKNLTTERLIERILEIKKSFSKIPGMLFLSTHMTVQKIAYYFLDPKLRDSYL